MLGLYQKGELLVNNYKRATQLDKVVNCCLLGAKSLLLRSSKRPTQGRASLSIITLVCTQSVIMAEHLPGRRAKVWLLYLKCTRGDRGRLSLNILREVCSYIHSPMRMTAVHYNQVYRYDLQSQTHSHHPIPVSLSHGTSYIRVGISSLLCVGGRVGADYDFSPSFAVQLLDLSSFKLIHLRGLSIAREGAGLAKVGACFYVFGGSDTFNCMSSCEKMQPSNQRWTKISNMNCFRAWFTPCHFRSLLYLASADVHRIVETFHAETETFTRLPISLPAYFNSGCKSVAFIGKGEMCLLTDKKQIACLKVETERAFRVSDTNQSSWSTQQPLKVDSLAFIACARTVQKFSLETYSFLDYYFPS